MAVRSDEIIEIIKRELKNKKLKYEDLADKLGMSVSGLKKSLASRDLSLIRLQAICDYLEVSLVQVLTEADDSKVKDVYLSEEQETLLHRSPEVFHLYWKIRFEGVAVHQYIQSTKIPRDEVRNRLRKLEKVGLLKVNSKGDIEFSDKGMIRWNNYGPLVQHLNRQWSSQLIESILQQKDPDLLLNLSLLNLSEASFAQMKQELRDLLDRYSTRSGQEKLGAAQKKLKKVAVLIAADEHDFMK